MIHIHVLVSQTGLDGKGLGIITVQALVQRETYAPAVRILEIVSLVVFGLDSCVKTFGYLLVHPYTAPQTPV